MDEKAMAEHAKVCNSCQIPDVGEEESTIRVIINEKTTLSGRFRPGSDQGKIRLIGKKTDGVIYKCVEVHIKAGFRVRIGTSIFSVESTKQHIEGRIRVPSDVVYCIHDDEQEQKEFKVPAHYYIEFNGLITLPAKTIIYPEGTTIKMELKEATQVNLV